jgi:hypothetical protein
VRYWELKDLFTPKEQSTFMITVSSIWWHSGRAQFGEGERANILTVPMQRSALVRQGTNAQMVSVGGGVFEFDARTGSLLSRLKQ